MKNLILSLCAIMSCSICSAQYSPDLLGRNFEFITIEQPEAFDGECVTTLVRHKPIKGSERAVLYVHGYNDYFFQEEMAQQFVDNQWQFYAVDLRRYGRSMREWHSPFAVKNIEEYFADIDAALDVMQSEGIKQIVVMGHSTGGLITSLYCHHNRANSRVDALILNSPFFDMNLGGGFVEGIAVPFVSWLGSAFGDWRIMKGNNFAGGYARSILKEYDGEWSFDTQFKRVESLPITASWIRAIHRGQKTLQKGLDISCPVLVLRSDKSVWGDYSPDTFRRGDSVLDVEDIAAYTPLMGAKVTEHVVVDGMHDLVLSLPEVRYPLYKYIFEWLEAQ